MSLSNDPATQPRPEPLPSGANRLFPVFLKLEQLHVLLVGGGNVGLEKLSAILNNSPAAAVTVVATRFLPELRELAARHPAVQLREGPYQITDLVGHDLVIVATDDKVLNLSIKADSTRQRLLCNVADTPDACDFYLGSIVQKGDLKIAISTNGKSPTVAKRIREMLTSAIPDELNDVLQRMSKIRELVGGDFANKVKSLNAVTAELTGGPAYESPAAAMWRRRATMALLAFTGLIALNILSYYITWDKAVQIATNADTFYIFVAIGFGAQLVDGLLGMGYGVVTAISLMSLNIAPAAVSASIHTAEMFASGASGYHHYRFGNVNKKLFKVLLIPGVLGAVTGAYLLATFGEEYAKYVKPFLAVYLLLLGIRIISKAFTKPGPRKKHKKLGFLAAAGGFLDSFGGGGWGPLVTSTLIAGGRTPQYVIGSVSVTEFFVTFASAVTFFATLGISHWQIILGLIVGGVAASPFAARLAGRIPTRWMFVGVGLMVIVWSLWALRKVFM
ncbi:TSUP family transporter [Hymenobacter sp. BT186]|uniref:Probable membrane transporter protein n=1 Tax=Hymenobacter telluris TaxID=2816474 RepID=A0A939J7D0_9BACT|nr:TSUP family transporter [Hymenobacter telluris]MBO0356604.1 TSUP family transporter [Hymenobacter telluris]MBW3372629.1 TSUP family transporter [Hymenobacter norwichensis]